MGGGDLMYLVQKRFFETVYTTVDNRGPAYLLAFRYRGRWVLCLTDSQLNYWFLGAQRGGLRQFRNLDTLQGYCLEQLRAECLQVKGEYPDRFPCFDDHVGLSALGVVS